MTDDQVFSFIKIEAAGTTKDDLDLTTRQLRLEIEEFDPEIVFITEQVQIPEGAKPLDPLTLGVLATLISSTILPKFLEFLHAWSMRREGQTVSIEIQSGKDRTLKVQVPASMDRQQVKAWIQTIQDSVKK